MEKDKSITVLIDKINEDTALNGFEVVDYWEGDLCAIGLKKGNRLVYINTYNSPGTAEMKYDLDLELLQPDEPYNVVKAIREVSETQLFKEIQQFLA